MDGRDGHGRRSIAVFDAKCFYDLGRPITAMRDGDLDGNDATAPEPGWTPFIDTPHPPFISLPPTTSFRVSRGRARCGDRHGASANALLDGRGRPQHVGERRGVDVRGRSARILDGVHYRSSTEVGSARAHGEADRRVRGAEATQSEPLMSRSQTARDSLSRNFSFLSNRVHRALSSLRFYWRNSLGTLFASYRPVQVLCRVVFQVSLMVT